MMKKSLCFGCVSFFLLIAFSAYAQKKIVVLGSSTAAGSGASSYSNSWVGKYTTYITGLGMGHTLTNLAVGGYNTYQILPTGTPHPGRPGQDAARNITAAVVTYDADIVLVNMPTNDVANSYDVSEVLLNYRRIKAYCDSNSVTVYFTTSQPRNFADAGRLGQLMQIRDSTHAQYGQYAIDFWTTLANADGTIAAAYNSGDGVHVNDAAHDILFNRVKAKPVFGGGVVLPVFFKRFSGLASVSGYRLEWEIAGSAEQIKQEVQWSKNGLTFSPIGYIPETMEHLFFLNNVKQEDGPNYYRIKLITSSSIKFSQILFIDTKKSNTPFLVFPNPVKGSVFQIQLNQTEDENLVLKIYSLAGSEIYTSNLRTKKGTSIYPVVLPETIEQGIYLVSLSRKQSVKQQLLVIQ